MRVIAILGAAVSFALFVLACPLHDPVPVEPDYPPLNHAHDAGRE